MEHEMPHGKSMQSHYVRLLAMTILAFLTMYTLMYAMVNTLGDVLNNFNQVYMAGLMTAPMVIIELLLMGRMYPSKTLNAALVVASVVATAAFWMLVRQQGAIFDRQFLRSMIPHHSAAILMCEKAAIRDPEILKLCERIVSSQRAEIDQMKAKLKAMDEN